MQSRWFSSRSMLLHAALAVWVPGCALAAWWQVTIALAGDHLAYLYSVEWPCFAIFGVVVWWNLIHDDPETVGARALRRPGRSAAGQKVASPDAVDGAEDADSAAIAERISEAEAADPELAAYNDYLEELAARASGGPPGGGDDPIDTSALEEGARPRRS